MIDKLLAGIARLATRRPRCILAVALLLTAASLWAGRGLTLRTDLTQLLPTQGVASSALRDLLEHFGIGDPLLVMLSLPSGQPDDSDAAERLADAGDQLAEILRGSGLFRSVACRIDEAALAEALRLALDHLPALVAPERAAELEARLSEPAMGEALRDLRRRLLSPASGAAELLAAEDPLGLIGLLPLAATGASAGFQIDLADGLFLAPDRRALLVIGEPLRPPFDLDFSHRLMQKVREAIRQVEASRAAEAGESAQVEFIIAGGHRIAAGDESMMRRDMTLTALASLCGVLAVFWLVFRTPRALGLAAAPLAMSAIWSLGLAALAPGHLNAVTVGFAAILFGLGDDSALHFYNRFAEERRRGAEVEEAARRAIQGSGRAILAANLTTALAFALLAFTQFEALAELALLAQYGIASLIVTMLVVLPALLVVTSARWRAGETAGGEFHIRVPGLDAALRGVCAHPRTCIAASAAAVCLAALFLPALSFDFDLRRLRPAASPAVRDERALRERFGAAGDTAYLLHEAPDIDRALLAAGELRPGLEAARRRGEILGFELPSPLLKTADEQAKSIAALRERGALEGSAARLRRALAAEGFRPQALEPAVLRLERWESDEGLAFSAAQVLAADWTPFATSALRSEPGRVWLSVPVHFAEGDAGKALSSFWGKAQAAGFRMAHLPSAVRETQEQVARTFRDMAVAAPLIVFVISWALLGSVSAATLALVPMACGVLAALALAGAAAVPISSLTLIVTPLLFGLGVDYGIYMVHAAREAGERPVPESADGAGAPPDAGGLASAGRTVAAASATTLIGFASLCLAEFRGLREIGMLAACGILAAVLAALLTLPAALTLLERRRKPG